MSSVAAQQLQLLRNAYDRGDEIVAVHYACENLHEVKDRPAAVSCISCRRVGGTSVSSFSVIDAPAGSDPAEAEVALLERFFDYGERQSGVTWVHWNMNRSGYGFSALSARYLHLTGGRRTFAAPEDRRVDLDDLIQHQFGADYVPHPRLVSTAMLNNLRRKHALLGGDEADRVAAGDHNSVRRSVDEKVEWLDELCRLLLDGRLVTERSAGLLEFAGTRLDAVQTVLAVARRMRDVERQLARRHANRPTLTVADEYDVQDLLHSLLKVFVDDIRAESSVPEHVGQSSRIDFKVPAYKLAIELKRARPGVTSGKIGEELVVDVARYVADAQVRHLLCIVFDYDGILENPRGLEQDLARDASHEAVGVTVAILDR